MFFIKTELNGIVIRHDGCWIRNAKLAVITNVIRVLEGMWGKIWINLVILSHCEVKENACVTCYPQKGVENYEELLRNCVKKINFII